MILYFLGGNYSIMRTNSATKARLAKEYPRTRLREQRFGKLTRSANAKGTANCRSIEARNPRGFLWRHEQANGRTNEDP